MTHVRPTRWPVPDRKPVDSCRWFSKGVSNRAESRYGNSVPQRGPVLRPALARQRSRIFGTANDRRRLTSTVRPDQCRSPSAPARAAQQRVCTTVLPSADRFPHTDTKGPRSVTVSREHRAHVIAGLRRGMSAARDNDPADVVHRIGTVCKRRARRVWLPDPFVFSRHTRRRHTRARARKQRRLRAATVRIIYDG